MGGANAMVHEQLYRLWVRQQVERDQLRRDRDARRIAEATARVRNVLRVT